MTGYSNQFEANLAMSHAEQRVRDRAADLAEAETAVATEYLRLVGLGTSSWEAQHLAQAQLGTAVRMAQAEYDIALEALRRLR